jgi:hypothetical protein
LNMSRLAEYLWDECDNFTFEIQHHVAKMISDSFALYPKCTVVIKNLNDHNVYIINQCVQKFYITTLIMIANSLIYVGFNTWLLKSEYSIVTSLQPNKFKNVIFKIIINISSTRFIWVDKCHMKCLKTISSVDRSSPNVVKSFSYKQHGTI